VEKMFGQFGFPYWTVWISLYPLKRLLFVQLGFFVEGKDGKYYHLDPRKKSKLYKE